MKYYTFFSYKAAYLFHSATLIRVRPAATSCKGKRKTGRGWNHRRHNTGQNDFQRVDKSQNKKLLENKEESGLEEKIIYTNGYLRSLDSQNN